jgi:hypothetical protein
MKKSLSKGALCLMHLLMADETISKKVELAPGKGKSYARYDIREDGIVVLGETNYVFWNRLIGCQRELSFESWALAVWDALVDLSTGGNATALEEGLSTEIAVKAQREEDYEWVVKRLYDCYEHVCNNKNDGMSSAGDRDNNGSNANSRTVLVDGQPVVVNINADGLRKQLKFPDATGRAFLKFDVGIVGVNVEKS